MYMQKKKERRKEKGLCYDDPFADDELLSGCLTLKAGSECMCIRSDSRRSSSLSFLLGNRFKRSADPYQMALILKFYLFFFCLFRL